MGSSIIGAIASMVVGGALAGATLFGLVSSQTSGPDNSPAQVNSPVIQYGDN